MNCLSGWKRCTKADTTAAQAPRLPSQVRGRILPVDETRIEGWVSPTCAEMMAQTYIIITLALCVTRNSTQPHYSAVKASTHGSASATTRSSAARFCRIRCPKIL